MGWFHRYMNAVSVVDVVAIWTSTCILSYSSSNASKSSSSFGVMSRRSNPSTIPPEVVVALLLMTAGYGASRTHTRLYAGDASDPFAQIGVL